MKRMFVYVSALALIVASQGCSLSSGYSSPSAAFRLTHLSPDQGGLDIYLNGTLFTSDLTYETTTSAYSSVNPGTYNFVAYATGTTYGIINTNLSFSSGDYYSVFIIDSAKAITTATVRDSVTASADSAKIRILDLAPIGDTVNIATTGTPAPPIAVTSNGRVFNDQVNNPSYASFITVPAGTYTFNVVQPSTSTVFPLEGNSQTQVFVAGKIYTLVLTGFANSSFNSESLTLLTIGNN